MAGVRTTKPSTPSPSIGLDFGTSTTLLARRTGELPTPVTLGEIDPWIASDAWFDPDSGSFIVGEKAAGRTPQSQLIRSVKQHVTSGVTTLEIRLGDGREVELEVATVIREILSETHRRITELAPDSLTKGPLFLGCPAMWDGAQRRTLISAAEQAGFPVDLDHMLDEPIAAGVAWAWDQQVTTGTWPEGNILVIDFGGGTLDAAVLMIEENGNQITVLASEAVPHAGDDLDTLIFNDLRSDLEEAGFDIEDTPDPESAKAMLHRAARELKHLLSDEDGGPERTVRSPLTTIPLNYQRERLEDRFAVGLAWVDRVVEWTLRAAQLRKRIGPGEGAREASLETLKNEIQHVLLVGGMSHEPSLRRHVERAFPNALNIQQVKNPQEAVAAGLALSSLFDGLNLHRPAFSVRAVLKKQDRMIGDQILYEAFDPIYHRANALMNPSRLGVERTIGYPRGERGRVEVGLVFESLGGQQLEVSLSGEKRTPWLHLDPRGSCRFKLYADGKVAFGSHRLRLSRWPVIRSGGYVIPIEPSDDGDAPPDQVGHWWGERP